MITYTVRCQFLEDSQLADHWLAWLRDIHIDDVIQCGAQAAEIVKMDEELPTYEIRYQFPSREAFTAYETDHAPRLRQEGLELFPLDQGFSYHRTVGEVIFSSPEQRSEAEKV